MPFFPILVDIFVDKKRKKKASIKNDGNKLFLVRDAFRVFIRLKRLEKTLRLCD